jgi:hypothetical protein
VLTQLDWSTPWLEPLRANGESLAERLSTGSPLHLVLNEQSAAPVRFIPQSGLPADASYESYVFESGCCPVRENLHDLFNGLIWGQYPQSKRHLNELQAAEIARAGVAGRRGPVRDAMTLFDENGAMLHAPAALWDALLARDWRRLFVDLRPLWDHARLLVFGHALLEKLVRPRKGITAHVWCAPCPAAAMAEVDGWLAAQLTPERLARKPLTPLPLMGIPGWCRESENFSFYDDSLVFRPPAGKTS